MKNNLSITKQNNNCKKILFVTTEARPFCATGGLADVCGSLPKEIKKINSNIDIRVMLPLYSIIDSKLKEKFQFLGSTYIFLSWRKEYCGIFEYKYNEIIFYFIDNEKYFKRDNGIYGYFDDAERFAFFSKATLDVLPIINFYPDIIQSNDWESALIPVYLKTSNWNFEYNKIKTILAIHNIQYQGRYSRDILIDVLGIDKKYQDIMLFDNDVNILKGGIICSDKIITVSPSYSDEIKTVEYGGGLHNIMIDNAYKLCGILNGIDYDFYNPEIDKTIFYNYSKDNILNKQKNKELLQKEFDLEINSKKAILSFCSRMNYLKGFNLIKLCIEKLINELDIQLIGVGSGETEFEDYFRYLNKKYPKKVCVSIGFSNEISKKIYSGADIYLMPSMTEPCGLSQIIASRYGVVPIVRETGGLKDTIKDFGCINGGNGYTFKDANVNDFEYTIKRAVKDFQNKIEWDKKIEKIMNIDFSWKETAKQYISIYNQI